MKRVRSREKPIDLGYHKWAHLGVPMLISAGDDTKLFAYSVKEFTKFSPHDICPAPQRVLIQLALNTVFDQSPLLLVQASYWLDILSVRIKSGAVPGMVSGPSNGLAKTDLLIRVKSKAAQKISCSTVSTSGLLFAYSDHVQPHLFKLKRSKVGKRAWKERYLLLPSNLPFAHAMVFTFDASQLIIAGHDRRIYVSLLFQHKHLIISHFTFCLAFIMHEEHVLIRLGLVFCLWYTMDLLGMEIRLLILYD